eukprot:4117730-Karenia_brevis.AAC.1
MSALKHSMLTLHAPMDNSVAMVRRCEATIWGRCRCELEHRVSNALFLHRFSDHAEVAPTDYRFSSCRATDPWPVVIGPFPM